MLGCLFFLIIQRAKKVFDPSDVEVVPRKRGRPVGTGKKNREQRNSFATTPERSKSPFNLTGSSPLNSYSHSGEFKACIICKYYTVISRGVTSKMLACSECNRNGIEDIFIYLLVCVNLYIFQIILYSYRSYSSC
jgi:hypothetical protein